MAVGFEKLTVRENKGQLGILVSQSISLSLFFVLPQTFSSKYAILLSFHIMVYNLDFFSTDHSLASCTLRLHPVLKHPRFKDWEFHVFSVTIRS
jgi:hypothetical protein